MSVSVGMAEIQGARFDVCVVGSGPVGLSVAVALARRGVRVLLLDAGLERPDRAGSACSDAHIVDPDRHSEMRLAVARAFGGTGWLWGGRCVPLDPIDFMARSHVDPHGWPISHADLAPHHDEAAALIGCGSGQFELPVPRRQEVDGWGIDLGRAERWCSEPNVGVRLKKLGLPASLSTVLDATVVDLELDPSGASVAALHIVSASRRTRFDGARAIVLACGGLETTRLLLHVQAHRPELFGGIGGPLGRFYMGHMSGRIARLRFAKLEAAECFAYVSADGGVCRRRIAFTPDLLERHRLPNVIFFPDNPMLGDPQHRSGLLSTLFLALSTPVIGKRLIAEAIRRTQMSGPPRYLAHLRNIVLDAPAAVRQVGDVLWQCFALGRRKPFVFLRSGTGEYPLHYHGEPQPSAESRVTLGPERDAKGMQRLRIDLRFLPEDGEAIARSHTVLDGALRQSGLGELVFDAPLDKLPQLVLSKSHDGFHQIGLARMGKRPDDGVVDENCKAFGIDNLFLAGSAVFRTAGQANPTFSAVALGVRLAIHLARQVAARTAVRVAA